MSLTPTTLASACLITDSVLVLTSSTGVAAGYIIQVDQEQFQVVNSYIVASNGVNVPVLRAQDGTVAQAHQSGANATIGIASDTAWGSPAPQTDVQFPIAARARTLTSYSAAGALTLPQVGNDAVGVINGTNALAMTLADPTKDMDGCILYVISNGKAAHTVVYTAGFGNAGGNYDTATFSSSGQNAAMFMACNGIWNLLSPMTGTLTNAVPALA